MIIYFGWQKYVVMKSIVVVGIIILQVYFIVFAHGAHLQVQKCFYFQNYTVRIFIVCVNCGLVTSEIIVCLETVGTFKWQKNE